MNKLEALDAARDRLGFWKSRVSFLYPVPHSNGERQVTVDGTAIG